jgi:hypothetical protein
VTCELAVDPFFGVLGCVPRFCEIFVVGEPLHAAFGNRRPEIHDIARVVAFRPDPGLDILHPLAGHVRGKSDSGVALCPADHVLGGVIPTSIERHDFYTTTRANPWGLLKCAGQCFLNLFYGDFIRDNLRAYDTDSQCHLK